MSNTFSPLLPQAEADAVFIETGLSHLSEDSYLDEETGNYYYMLEDGRSVKVSSDRQVTVYDAD